MATTKKLYRSQQDRLIAGVCGGLGEYFNTDSNLIRIIFAIAVLAAGLGAIIYIVMALIVPEEGTERSVMEDFVATQTNKKGQTQKPLKKDEPKERKK